MRTLQLQTECLQCCCARVLILKQFVQHVPVNTGATLDRRRWVLAQVLPPSLNFQDEDLFVRVLWTLRSADTQIMRSIIASTLKGSQTPLFVVLDEGQVAADNLKEYFRSDTGTDMRPILREMYRFFLNTQLFTGFILSGTGLSMKMVPDAVGSISAKNAAGSGTRVFTDIGRFTRDDSSQLDYIRRYLTLSDNNSDRRLLERMVYWFSGRHRLTASLIELFICLENVPRHHVLTSFAERLTGFKVTDAIELEDDEPPISPELSALISHYRSIGELEHVFNEENSQCNISFTNARTNRVFDRRGLDTMPSRNSYAVDFGKRTYDHRHRKPYARHNWVGLLSLSSVLQKHRHTMRKTWIANAFRSAHNASVLGYVFEQAILLMLMETFGGEFKPLSHAFRCSESLESRKSSWKTGNSDRLGLKANSPEDVLAFLHDPDGKPFLFPDNHMGPDVMCTLQDKETKELIILAVQAKVSPTLNAQKWRNAIISVTPKFFYTMQKTPQAQQQSASHSTRRIPRFLRIIATPDDEQQKRLKGEWKGDVAVLRWDVVVERYIGSMADSLKARMPRSSQSNLYKRLKTMR
ncbi:hypothetical protein BU17DRAFT_72416 [Hysterangium stoloniferum]|nr:hypothetical protein BU17DRAFT_72416 [Hysterangium stoloniferum]